jgi:hypothetical protein
VKMSDADVAKFINEGRTDGYVDVELKCPLQVAEKFADRLCERPGGSRPSRKVREEKSDLNITEDN